MSRRHLIDGSGVMVRCTIPTLLHMSGGGGSQYRVSFTQTHGYDRVAKLRSQGGFNVVTLGTDTSGASVNETLNVNFMEGVFSTSGDWPSILDCMRDPSLEVVHTNQREDGFGDMAGTGINVASQPSLTARLVTMLYHRWLVNAGPITVMCWELILGNGPKMKEQVIKMAERFLLPPGFIHWLKGPEVWFPSTVQNIICVQSITGKHPDVNAQDIASVMEPIPMFGIAIEEHPYGLRPFEVDHPNVLYLSFEELAAVFRTKNWFLNKLHVALVARWIAERLGFTTVLEAMSYPGIEDWLAEIGKETIALHKGELTQAEQFLEDVIRRFKNPHIAHQLSAIAGGIESKWEVRVRPTLEKIGRKKAPLLTAVHDQHLQNLAERRYARFQQ